MPHLPFIEQFIHIPEIDTAMYRVAGLQINNIVVLFIKSLWFHKVEETPKLFPMYELNLFIFNIVLGFCFYVVRI